MSAVTKEFNVSVNADGFMAEATCEGEDSTATYEFVYDDGDFFGGS